MSSTVGGSVPRALLDAHDSLVQRREQAEAEIQELINTTNRINSQLNESLPYSLNNVNNVNNKTTYLAKEIEIVTSTYFTFKNLNSATRDLTKNKDKYYTKYRYYTELRRITLGYTIGLDINICSNERMRKIVEDVYLKNVDYWLSYAIMAVMLWSNDEREASQRALEKSIKEDYESACLFYMLINLRFGRNDVAKKWYIAYLDRINTNNVGPEYKYLLQAYMSGSFGRDKLFDNKVKTYFKDTFELMKLQHADFGRIVTNKVAESAMNYPYKTDESFPMLERYCVQYEELKELLSYAEKNEVLKNKYLLDFNDSRKLVPLNQRIEDVLYDLINSYEKEEFETIKKIKFNEAIIRSKGDIQLATNYYNSEIVNDMKRKPLHEMIYEWGIEDNAEKVDNKVKIFAIKVMKDWIINGFSQYAKKYRGKEAENYKFSIDGWEGSYSEISSEEAEKDLLKFYSDMKIKEVFKDKYFRIFSCGICLALILLVISAFYFNPITLVMGILLGISSGFLLWRCIVEINNQLIDNANKSKEILKGTIKELSNWRKRYKEEDKKNEWLLEIFSKIDA